MFCPNCGEQIRDDAQFCPQCGAEVPTWVAEGAQGSQNGAAAGSVADYTRVMNNAAPEAPKAESTMSATVAAPAAETPHVQEQQPETPTVPESQPRKRGGALKVAAVVLLIAVIAGGVGGGVWYVMDQQNREMQAQIDGLQDQLDAQDDEDEEETAKGDGGAKSDSSRDNEDEQGADEGSGSRTSASDEDDADAGVQSFVGTWTGDLVETNTFGLHCYGAEGHPLRLTIKSINETTGQMKFDVEVLYHNHEVMLESDADSCDGDTVLTFSDVTATFDPEMGFSASFDIEGGDEWDSIDINVVPETYSYGQRLNVTVESRKTFPSSSGLTSNEITTDTYQLSKA